MIDDRALAQFVQLERAKARRETLEAVKALVEGRRIIGGEVIGPLYRIGWNAAIADVIKNLDQQLLPRPEGPDQ